MYKLIAHKAGTIISVNLQVSKHRSEDALTIEIRGLKWQSKGYNDISSYVRHMYYLVNKSCHVFLVFLIL